MLELGALPTLNARIVFKTSVDFSGEVHYPELKQTTLSLKVVYLHQHRLKLRL
jgi:hypothetical protein